MKPSNDYMQSLNEVQRKAVRHFSSPLLILAGAGSGKTRVITVKIAYLVDRMKVDPRSILAVTFTNKAAGEMRERAAALAPGASDVMIRTFHSFGAWILRRHSAYCGLSPRFTIYDEDEMVTLLSSIFSNYKRNQLSSYAFLIGRAKDYGLLPDSDLSIVGSDPKFPEIYKGYESRLREIGNADFGDLILKPVQLLKDNPEIKKRMQDRFHYILVDEYQDSNVAQFELLRQLAGKDTYICAVGDDDQSIYRFRGAEVKNILNFSQNFPPTEIIRLEENYRSTNHILKLAGEVVKNNSGRLGKELWTRRQGGVKPVLAVLDDQEKELEYVKDLVLSPDEEKETAVLYRTNAQSRSFETAFLHAGIPYRIIGTLRFYEREEIKDAVAFLKFFINRKDEVSFRRIINKPSRGIGPVSVEKIVSQITACDGDLLKAASHAVPKLGRRAGESVDEFRQFIASLEEGLSGASLKDFVELVIKGSGLAEFHQKQDEISGSQKIQNLEELVNAASLYSGSRDGLSEFLESIEIDSVRQQDTGEGENPVILITMHNTKGLEFDRVIITGLEEGLFPRDGTEAREDLEEERRLFYVAITRARDEIHLISCRKRRIYGRLMTLRPTRFLNEISEDCLAPADGAGAAVQRRIDQNGAESGSGSPFPAGSAVYHDEYGTGMVVKQWFNGSELMVSVRFENGKTAHFIAEYSGLERISIDV